MCTVKAILGGIAREIRVHGRDVKLLSSPSEFRDTLLKLSSEFRCRSRISCLYVGNGQNEQQIISNLVTSVKNHESDVSVMIDRYRGLRDGGIVFKDLKRVSPIHLYQVPSMRRLGYKKPAPLGEFLGVHHIKYYLFDDTVIISGANLSEMYFGPRQDRYMVIKSTSLADYICYLHNLHSTSSKLWDTSSYTKTHWSMENIQVAKSTTERLSCNTPLDNNETRFLGPKNGDTYIYPLFQHPWFSIHQIDDTLDILLSNATANDVFTCSSGYFNPTPRLTEALQHTKAQVNIIIPSREANGFYGGRFLKSYVPDMYNVAAIRTLQKCPNVSIQEFCLEDWSYHAKGWWHNKMSIIGSSNFNKRSSNRDTEFCIALTTECGDLSHSLEEERHRLSSLSVPLERSYRSLGYLSYPFISSYL